MTHDGAQDGRIFADPRLCRQRHAATPRRFRYLDLDISDPQPLADPVRLDETLAFVRLDQQSGSETPAVDGGEIARLGQATKGRGRQEVQGQGHVAVGDDWQPQFHAIAARPVGTDAGRKAEMGGKRVHDRWIVHPHGRPIRKSDEGNAVFSALS